MESLSISSRRRFGALLSGRFLEIYQAQAYGRDQSLELGVHTKLLDHVPQVPLDGVGRDPQAAGCLVLDVRLPGTSGLELQKRLVAQKDRIPIIFISGYGDVPMAVQVMKAGAVDFLQKPFREQELLECVQAALRRDQALREVEEKVSGMLSGYRSLTKREREIMKLVVTGQINKQIAAQVGLSEVTVKIHRAQVMHKMGTPSLADLVRAADKIEAFLS